MSWANKLESTGVPGRVHISGCTRGYLKDGQFTLENGDPRMTDNNNGHPRPLEEWLRLFERTPGKETANLRSRYEQIFDKRQGDAPRQGYLTHSWTMFEISEPGYYKCFLILS